MVRIGRNEKCHFNSDKKYKKCCEKKVFQNEKYFKGQSESSLNILEIKQLILEDNTSFNVIDITNDISIDNYKTYQIKNYSTNVIMLAERTEKNTDFFSLKEGKMGDNFIIMYRGSYRIFNNNDFLLVYDSIQKMIDTRSDGIEDN